MAACRAHCSCRMLERARRGGQWHGLFQRKSASKPILVAGGVQSSLISCQVSAKQVHPACRFAMARMLKWRPLCMEPCVSATGVPPRITYLALTTPFLMRSAT